MSKFTAWFPGTIKPVRVGVYQTLLGSFPVYRKWTGEYWCSCFNEITHSHLSNSKSFFQQDLWRGLAQDPKGKK
jgi:hypothetical protein